MICKDCGREIPEHSIYCNWCGVKQLRERRSREEVKVPTPKQLPSGSWTVYLRAEGQSVTEPTRELCLARARALRAGFLEAKKSAGGMTLGAAYDAYMEARQGVISPSTYGGYVKLKRSAFVRLMAQDISRITSEQVQREISQMALEGKSRKYIANAVGLLSSVLRAYAPDVKLDVRLPQKRKAEPRKIEDDEIGAIMAAVRGTVIELPVLMGLWLGMRRSAARALRISTMAVCISAARSSRTSTGSRPRSRRRRFPATGGWIFRRRSSRSSQRRAAARAISSRCPGRQSTKNSPAYWRKRASSIAVSTTCGTPTRPSWCASA